MHAVIVAWMAKPVPVRHVTRDDGTRVVEFAAINPFDVKQADTDRITDAQRLLIHAGVFRRIDGRNVKGSAFRHRLVHTDVGRQVARSFGVA